MINNSDAVDSVLLAYLDFLEGAGPEPAMDHLTADERSQAEALIASLRAGRGIDPHASRPSLEALLFGSEFESSAATAADTGRNAVTLMDLRSALAGVDQRTKAELDTSLAEPTVVFSYLDVRVRFVLVDAGDPEVSDDVRATVAAIFMADSDTSHVGVVAARSDELVTQMLAVDDLGATITTPHGHRHDQWEPPLPLTMTARRVLEQTAPEWDAFDLDPSLAAPLDVADLARDIASRVVAREAARPFKGEKGRAYKALVGHEDLLADLVAKVSATDGAAVDLEAETTRIARAAA